MIGNFIFAVSGLIELSIGALLLAVAVLLKRVEMTEENPLNRERLFLFPYAGVLLLSGLFLLMPAIKPLRSLIQLNLHVHLLTALFSPCCCGLMARRTPFKSDHRETGYNVNIILGTVIGMSVLEFLFALVILCYGFAVMPPRDSEDTPVPKPGSSTTTDPLCPKNTKHDSEPAETPDQ